MILAAKYSARMKKEEKEGGPIQHFNQGVGHMAKESIQQLLTLSVKNELG
jgi:hypothetical protein